MVHRRAHGAGLGLGHIRHRRALQHRTGCLGRVGEYAGGALADGAVQELDDLQDGDLARPAGKAVAAADGRVQVPTDELKRLEPAPAEFAADGCRWSAANDRSAANFARSAIRGLRPARLCC